MFKNTDVVRALLVEKANVLRSMVGAEHSAKLVGERTLNYIDREVELLRHSERQFHKVTIVECRKVG